MEHLPENNENQSSKEDEQNANLSEKDSSDETQLANLEADLAKLSEENPKVANVIRGLFSITTTRISHVEEHFSGPLPHPAIMAKYEQILPGSADRIMTSAESQMQHRQSLETAVVHANIKGESWGLVFSGTIALVFAVGSLVLIYTGKSLEGLATIIGETVILVGVFLRAQKSRQEERTTRRQELTKARGGRSRKD